MKTVPPKVDLTHISDLDLVRKVKKHQDNEAFLVLVERHYPLYFNTCNRYLNLLKIDPLALEDFYNDSYFYFWDAIHTFRFNKRAKFTTYLVNYLRYKFLKLRKKNQHKIKPNVTDDLTYHLNLKNKTFKDYHLMEFVLDTLNNLPDKRIKQVFTLSYLQGCYQKDIAKTLKISIPTCRSLHQKGMQVISEKLWQEKILTS